MTLQVKPAAYKYTNVQAERDLMGACRRLSRRVLKLLDRDRKRKFVKSAPALGATIVIVLSLTTSAIVQEGPHAYSEYTYWRDEGFENGHTFSSTVGARNYQLENRIDARVAALGGGVRLFTSSRRTAIDLGYKYHHISTKTGEIKIPDWIPTCCLSGCRCFDREVTV